jgi:hypothetical protein
MGGCGKEKIKAFSPKSKKYNACYLHTGSYNACYLHTGSIDQ